MEKTEEQIVNALETTCAVLAQKMRRIKELESELAQREKELELYIPKLPGLPIVDSLIVDYMTLRLRTALNDSYIETTEGLKTAIRVISHMRNLADVRYPLNADTVTSVAVVNWIDRNMEIRSAFDLQKQEYPFMLLPLNVEKHGFRYIGVPIPYHPAITQEHIKKLDQYFDPYYKLGTKITDLKAESTMDAVFCHLLKEDLVFED